MTADELAEARKLCEAATDGQWQRGVAGNCNLVSFDGCDIVGIAADVADHNLAFIAASRTLVPQLLDEVERVRDGNRDLAGAGLSALRQSIELTREHATDRREIVRLDALVQELRAENEKLRDHSTRLEYANRILAEASQRMSPVYDAAKAWHHDPDTWEVLYGAITAALAKEPR